MKMHYKHALDEVLANIASRDLIKARIVIGCFGHLEVSAQRRILFEVDKCDDAFALPLLIIILLADNKSLANYPTLEESILAKAMASPDVVLQELPNTSTEQFYYAHLCGKLCIEEACHSLNTLLMTSNDTIVLKETMKALGSIASPLAINNISEFLTSTNSTLAYEALQALGKIATPTAIKRLSEMLGRDEGTDMLILDIFARVQDEVSLHKLNDTIRSSYSRLRNYSKQKIVEIGSKALPILAENLDQRDIDLQIHSLNILTDIGDESSVLPVRRLLQAHPIDANVRFAAYEAMAALPNLHADYVLAAGLEDENDNVRMAAARAIDVHFNGVLASGIKNMVTRQDGMATRIIKAVLDSQTEQIFLSLLSVSFFWKVASTYLATKAHKDTREFYLSLLNREHLSEQVQQLEKQVVQTPSTSREIICAVDDSKMILSVYRTVLTELGYDPILFSNPEEALVWLRSNKPLLLCTDLNMPELSGLELSRLTRELYPKEKLPIIMVTTQNDRRDKTKASEVGVNTIMQKPFNADQLAISIKEVTSNQDTSLP